MVDVDDSSLQGNSRPKSMNDVFINVW